MPALFDVWVSGVFGDKNKGYQNNFPCPYMLCPSHTDHNGQYCSNFHKPRMKFWQKIQPRVYEYKCLYCGCFCNVSVETMPDGRESWRVNPALIGGRPSSLLWGGARW